MRPLKVGILGATGLVGRACSAAIACNPNFVLGTLVGSGASNNQPFEKVWKEKEQALVDHYGAHLWKPMAFPEQLEGSVVEDFQTMLCPRDHRQPDDLIISAVPLRAGKMEDELLKYGHSVYSASPHRRYDPDVPLCVAEVNAHVVLRPDTRFVKSPNCCSNGVCLAIAPLHEAYGINELCVTTYQALSGRGDLKYDRELVSNNIYPIGKTEENTEKYIEREVKKVFQHTPAFRVSVSCQRVPTQKNHFIDLRLRTARRPQSYEEVVALLRSFNPLQQLNDDGKIPHGTTQPIVVREEVGYPRPIMPAGESELGMQIQVGNIRVNDDDMYSIRMAVLVDNIDRGAFGGALQNAQIVLNHLRATQLRRTHQEDSKLLEQQQQLQLRRNTEGLSIIVPEQTQRAYAM